MRLRDRQFVGRLGEMIHPDVHIAGSAEALDRVAEQRELHARLRKLRLLNPALRLEQRGQVGIRVQRNAIRIAGDDLPQRRLETFDGLFWQSVDQVDVDRAEAMATGGFDHLHRFFDALDPVDRALDRGVEILDAHRQPVESERGELGDAVGACAARVDFDREFAMRIEIEGFAQPADQPRGIGLGKERRRSTAPVHPCNLALAAQRLADKLDLAPDRHCIAVGTRAIPGRDLVAGAIEAERVAERHMQIQSEGPCQATDAALPKVVPICTVIECFDETVGGGIGCVTRPVSSVFAD